MTATTDDEFSGTPVSGLPTRPVRLTELRGLAAHDRVDELRVPSDRTTQQNGPVLVDADSDETTSEFHIWRGEQVTIYTYGYPERASSAALVSTDAIQWYRHTIDPFDRWDDAETAAEIRQSFRDETEPLGDALVVK